MTTGLRERKKQRTRQVIQGEALRLFREQGYAGTSCEQVAAAAGVSPATLFRYFPTKEDLVLDDVYDPMIAELVRSRPATEGPVTAARNALATALGGLDDAAMEPVRQRTALILSVPALRARAHEQRTSLVDHLGRAFAARRGGAADDLDVRVAAEAVAAVVGLAVERWADHGGELVDHMDAALAVLGTVNRRAR